MLTNLCRFRACGSVLSLLLALPGTAAESRLETPALEIRVSHETGACSIGDKAAGVTWRSQALRFGEITVNVSGKPQRLPLIQPAVQQTTNALRLEFHPLTNHPAATLRVTVQPGSNPRTLVVSYDADAALPVESIRLLDEVLSTTDAAGGYVAVPTREGLLVPAESGRAFTQRFDTSGYEGCHMHMFGVVNGGAAALVTWGDPYTLLELRSATNNVPPGARQLLAPSLVLRKSSQSFQVEFLGKGDYVTIGKAYREVARQRGLLVTLDEKIRAHPQRAQLVGASNYKLWSTLSRRMSDDSSKEESVKVSWTFDEAAQVAEHLKRDLKLDRILFMMGGWIHRGYDNQHPDILPTAPECGGDAAFADACSRIRALGYTLSLHDNYQDIYRDSPSWDERWIQKNADGALTKGGHWAGGRAYITCSKMALELAQRPQNLRAVQKLSKSDSYFIDTTYAAGLQECFDKDHPLTRGDDMRWKQALSDYAREVFGIFGSECGREWAIPHSDFFEGLTGVSGGYYHNKDLVKNLGAAVIPLFEIVYRDCMIMWGKYGYDPAQAAEYVLHHIAMGRPLNYHIIPPHLYWKQPAAADGVAMRPGVAGFRQTGARQFSITYGWNVEKPATNDWRVFVHFTDPGSDAAEKIRFQNDHAPKRAVSQWAAGEIREGPFTVTVPESLHGTFAVRMGLYQPESGQRARLPGTEQDSRSCVVGKLIVSSDRIEFEPATREAVSPAGDSALFTRADGGWAEGLHVVDRFVKNTHEILSPLHEVTARVPVTAHAFLSADRKVQRSVFGDGAAEVIVNAGAREFRHQSPLGGNVVLPPYGFVVESPTFAAFCATEWNGEKYAAPTLFTLRSVDGEPLRNSRKIQVFHGFGESRIRLNERLENVSREAIITR